MASMTIRNLPDEIHDGLKLVAKNNHRSAEAEARHIISTTISQRLGGGLGVLMHRAWGDVADGSLQVNRSTEGPRQVSFE